MLGKHDAAVIDNAEGKPKSSRPRDEARDHHISDDHDHQGQDQVGREITTARGARVLSAVASTSG